MRIGAHAPPSLGRQGPQFGPQAAARVEQLTRLVAAQPALEQLQIRRVSVDIGERHLVRAPRALDLVAADLLGAGPALRRAQHDHWPARSLCGAADARVLLDGAYLRDDLVERGGHLLVHFGRLRAFDEIRLVPVADEQRLQFLMADAREDGRVGDLVAVQVEDRQHRPVPHRIDELVGMPRRGERPGLCLAVADDACDDEVGIVERGSIGVREAVAELAAFVDRARRLRRDVRADVTREGELLEEALHALLVFALVRIDLRISTFQVRGTEHARRAVTRAGHENHVEVVSLDHPIEMRPHERQRRARAPVAEQTLLHMLGLQRLLEQRVASEIDHAHREVVARLPPRIDETQLIARERTLRCGTGTHGRFHMFSLNVTQHPGDSHRDRSHTVDAATSEVALLAYSAGYKHATLPASWTRAGRDHKSGTSGPT